MSRTRIQLLTDIKAAAHFLKGYACPGGSDIPIVHDRALKIIEAMQDLEELDAPLAKRAEEKSPEPPRCQGCAQPLHYVCTRCAGGAGSGRA